MAELVNLNGELIELNSRSIRPDNRAYRYGDAVFETIRYTNGRSPLIADHIKRLTWAMDTLKMEVPDSYIPDYFETLIRGLVQANRIEGDAKVRLEVYRDSEGSYAPLDGKVAFTLSAVPLNGTGFGINEKGYKLAVYDEIRKPLNKLSSLKSSNALLFVMAGIYMNEQGVDECIILNSKGNICEAISSNIFLYKDKTLITPPASDGPVIGVMRKQAMKIAADSGYKIAERSVTLTDMMSSDEVFLTNAVNGIRWVGGFDQKRYFNSLSKLISIKLNQQVTKESQVSSGSV